MSWKEFCDEIASEYSRSPDTYLQERVISMTMHPQQGAVVKKYADWLIAHRPKIWEKYSMCELKTGKPKVARDDMSQSTIQNIYLLSNLKEYLNLELKDLSSITEVGAGYGNLASLARRIGFTKEYNLVDFDIMHTLQKRLLSDNNLCYNENYIDINGMADVTGGLMIATFSINEMPFEERDVIEQSIRNFDYIYIQYNTKIFGYDNYPYFDSLVERIEDTFEITRFDCEPYPKHPIIIGKKK